MYRRLLATILLAWVPLAESALDAEELVRRALDLRRGDSSLATMAMTIHRPEWQRSLRLKVWTRGTEESLVRVLSPKKDAGNATLVTRKKVWTYAPRINRIVKIPSSMMGQAWMGSDFSNREIARSDDILKQYDHRLIERGDRNGRPFYRIEMTPKENAAVVWGREEMLLRDDYVMLEHRFFDQEGVLVKILSTREIKQIEGRPVATVQRVEDAEQVGHWTEVTVEETRFGQDWPDTLFSRASLRNAGG